ncbi:hypothetical protein CM19_05455 [Candidatus Acidianus copahuensis]|uniref:Uncharacterized protein n=1 Tax=Candidatus Acidianus copahuensis TaxID=1160895 RepID=A0A031LQ04_9CREN|nr:hypothetical protein [Acidianus sp. RZ1]EZQ06820.1 hypothetical protein CM19_05455 [Candidatus Acidianus copahuensis]NON61505.1 hypothetical protein [Acidianus sp. RZ1]
MSQPDFLRHVASRVISPNSLDLKRLDDVRRLLAAAEAKYKFSSYGGDPKKLVNYLLSPDFTELTFILGTDLTKKLLEEIIKDYDYQEIKDAAKKILEEIDGYTEMEDKDAVITYKRGL